MERTFIILNQASRSITMFSTGHWFDLSISWFFPKSSHRLRQGFIVLIFSLPGWSPARNDSRRDEIERVVTSGFGHRPWLGHQKLLDSEEQQRAILIQWYNFFDIHLIKYLCMPVMVFTNFYDNIGSDISIKSLKHKT